ncbi:MAG: tRNA-dependent cyclodipeptide synthase [Candidatus Nanoarchaeia archaeon]
MNKANIVLERVGLASLTGYEIAESKGVAMLIISPENSYYNEENIKRQIECCNNIFSKTYIMIPEGPLVHNYVAEGYSSINAERKARLKCNNLRNKAARGIEEVVKENSSEINVIDWYKEISENKNYSDSLNFFCELYQNNSLFKEDVGKMVFAVLEKKVKEKSKEEAIYEGKKYVLEELALIFAAPKSYEENRIACVYHREWTLVENYINGKYGNKNEEIGCIVMN